MKAQKFSLADLDEFIPMSPEEAKQVAKKYATARECAQLHHRASEKQCLNR